MNGKKSKLIRRKAESKLIDWLRTMIPEGEDVSRINKKNLHEFLPEQTVSQLYNVIYYDETDDMMYLGDHIVFRSNY